MYERITKKLFSVNTVALFMHINPDGDCLGSALAMYKYLTNMGLRVDVFAEDSNEIGAKYAILPNVNIINAKTAGRYDLGIAVDCAGASRLGKRQSDIFFGKCEDHACFDHHSTSEPFVEDLIYENTASTTQILYKFFVENNPKYIDKDVAVCLYAGLVTDSGAFAFSNTTVETLEIASKLLKYGFDGHEIIFKLMKEETPEVFALKTRVLTGAKFYFDGQLGIIAFRKQDFIETKTTPKDTEGIINNIINIKGVKFAVSIAEMNECQAFKVGIRSKDGASASAFAKAFGGGGHFNASGCRIYADYETTTAKLIATAKSLLENND